MMSYLHTKFHDNWISSFRGVAMTRFWDGRTDRRTDRRTDGQTDGRTDGRSDCTPRPAFAHGDAGKKKLFVYLDIFCGMIDFLAYFSIYSYTRYQHAYSPGTHFKKRHTTRRKLKAGRNSWTKSRKDTKRDQIAFHKRRKCTTD